MKKKNLCALAIACLCLTASMDAQVSKHIGQRSVVEKPGGGGGESGNTAPELDAKSTGAGLLLLAGGALIVIGRRRKALA